MPRELPEVFADILAKATQMSRNVEALEDWLAPLIGHVAHCQGPLASLVQKVKDSRETFDSLIADLWIAPPEAIVSESKRASWSPEKAEDVARAMREGRI